MKYGTEVQFDQPHLFLIFQALEIINSHFMDPLTQFCTDVLQTELHSRSQTTAQQYSVAPQTQKGCSVHIAW